MISSRNRREAAGDGNTLKQGRPALQWILPRFDDFAQHENAVAVDLFDADGDDRILHIFSELARNLIRQLRGRLSDCDHVPDDRQGKPTVWAHLDGLREVLVSPHGDLEHIFRSNRIGVAHDVGELLNSLSVG